MSKTAQVQIGLPYVDTGIMISVVVVNWNSGDFLEKCVSSLLRHAAGCEIVIVDNASEDHSAEFLASVRPDLMLLRNVENAGFAAASNAGWRRSSGDFILFLNPDTECLPEAPGRLEQTLSGNPSIWACAGMLLPSTRPGNPGFQFRRLPAVSSVAAEMLLLDEIWPDNPWTRSYRMKGENFGSVREIEQPAAACLMVRRSALESLGGFDEVFRPAWFEDVDLCKRIGDAGGKIVLQPAAQFMHYGGYSLNRLPYGKFLEYYHTNQIRYFAKHHGRQEARRVRRLVVAGMRLRAAISLIHPLIEGCSRAQSFRLYRTAAGYFAKMSEGAA